MAITMSYLLFVFGNILKSSKEEKQKFEESLMENIIVL